MVQPGIFLLARTDLDAWVRTVQTLLRQLQGSNLSIEMPTLSDSLNAVRNYKAKP